MDKQILIYHIEDPKKKEALIREGQALDFIIKEVSEDEVAEKIGYLVGMEGYDESGLSSVAPQEEMILFAGADSLSISNLLQNLRETPYRFPHKASLTETTKDWSFKQLVEHIEVEHRVVNAYSKLVSSARHALALVGEKKNEELEKLLIEMQDLKEYGEDLREDHIYPLQDRMDKLIEKIKKEL